MPKAKLSRTGKVKSKSGGKVTKPNPKTKTKKVSTKADSSGRESRVGGRSGFGGNYY